MSRGERQRKSGRGCGIQEAGFISLQSKTSYIYIYVYSVYKNGLDNCGIAQMLHKAVLRVLRGNRVFDCTFHRVGRLP